MIKRELLSYRSETRAADAHQVAADSSVSYPRAAMSLLRLVRHALAARAVDPSTGPSCYQPSERGDARLAHFQNLEAHVMPFTRESESRFRGRSRPRRTKLHIGTYHCPTCFVQFDLVGEENLRCDRCEGPRATGSLDDVRDDNEDDE